MDATEVTLASGQTLSVHRSGAGGKPLLLLHGYPETMRIWARNTDALAAAGFDVIVPDLRGYGGSAVGVDGHHDVAAHTADMVGLLDVLGVERAALCGGDAGGVVAQDLSLGHPDRVDRMCLFNTVVPGLRAEYEAAGIPQENLRTMLATADYFIRQGTDADGLLAELDTPERRRSYIASFYTHRLWGSPDAFTPEDVAYHTEPFADAERLRSSWHIYETAMRTRTPSGPTRLREVNPTVTLVLYGPEDHVVPASFPQRCAVAFPNAVGPFVVPGAGHFLQWEQAAVLNRALAAFLL